MKKKKTRTGLIVFAVVVLTIFAALCAWTARRTFNELKSNESFDEVDYYSMQKYSDQSAEAVFSALKSGKTDKLKSRMLSPDGLEDVVEFADWSQADFFKAVGLGSGSLSPKPDKDGRIDMSERFIVEAGDTKYVFFIETVTSRWGRTYDGISAVAVTGYNHFDRDLNWDWLGEKSDESALAGELFRDNNQAVEQNGEETGGQSDSQNVEQTDAQNNDKADGQKSKQTKDKKADDKTESESDKKSEE